MPIDAYETVFNIENFCIHDPQKLVKARPDVLEKFDGCSSFGDRISCLMPVLREHYSVCPLGEIWPMDRNKKNNDKSDKYRIAGNKAFVNKDYDKVGLFSVIFGNQSRDI